MWTLSRKQEKKTEIAFVKHYAPNHMLASKDNITRKTPNSIIYFFIYFLFRFYGPFKNISFISSRSFIKGGRNPENPGKNHLTICKQNAAFPHVTQARLEPQPCYGQAFQGKRLKFFEILLTRLKLKINSEGHN